MGRNNVDGTPLGDSRVGARLDSTVISKTHHEYRKVIFSGSLVEEYVYESPLRVGFPNKKRKKRKQAKKPERTLEYRKRTGLIAQTKIKRLATLNFKSGAKFLTLTFRDNIDFDINNLSECHGYYLNFLKRLRRKVGKFNYICVPEKQKRGAIHYHMIIDIPYVDKDDLADLWSHGFVDIRKIDNVVHRSAYLAKYLSKNDNLFEWKGRRYFTSRGLAKPKILYGYFADRFIELVKKSGRTSNYQSSYKSEYNGEVKFFEYNLSIPARKEDT